MSSTLSNIQLGTSVATLDGLAVINADQLFVNGQNVNPAAPNIPTNPTSTNALYAILFTNSFGAQPSAPLLVDGTFGLGYNPATDTLFTQKLYTSGSIYAGGLTSNTPVYAVGLDSSSNLVKYTIPSSIPNQVNISATGVSTTWAIPFISGSGNQYIYYDTTVGGMTYTSNTKTLNIGSLNLTTVPAGTQTYLLAVDSAGNVIQGTAASTQLLTTQTPVGNTFYPTFVTSNSTGNKSYYVPYPAGYDIRYVTSGTLGAIGTLYTPQLVVEIQLNLPDLVVVNSATQILPIANISHALGVNSIGNLVKFVPSNQTDIAVASTNNAYNILFTSRNVAGIATVSIDSGLNLTYNPSTDTLTVPNLTVSSSASIAGYAPLASPALTGVPTGPTAAVGTNTTQLATCAFVLANSSSGSYLPLAGGTMSGTISFGGGTNNLISMYWSKFVQYTNTISDSGGTAYISITTDALNASPPLVGYVLISRPLTVSGALTVNNNGSLTGTLTVTGKITGNGGMTITSGGVTYANIGVSGYNSFYSDTNFYDTANHAVMQVSYGSGVNQNIVSTASYNWQTTSGTTGTMAMNLSSTQLNVGSQGIYLSNTTNPYLQIGANYFALATSAGAFLNDAVANDLIINSRTGNIRLGGGAQYVNSQVVVSNTATTFNIAGTQIAAVTASGLSVSNVNAPATLSLYGGGAAASVNVIGQGTNGLNVYSQGGSSLVAQIYSGPSTPTTMVLYNIPSIYFTGGGVNWYIAGAQAGYWDNAFSGWRINAISQLSIGGGGTYNCIYNPNNLSSYNIGTWNGGNLFTTSYTNSTTANGMCVGYTSAGGGNGYIIALQPSVAWREMWISAAAIHVFYYGTQCSYSQAGGWINVSDEREKTNIKPLKTSRSLERVLAAKTCTYNRIFYKDEAGNDLVSDEEKAKSHVGIVAQQIKESNPHCLSTWKNKNANDEERFGVNYHDYTIHLIGAVQEQQKQINSQAETIALLTKHLTDLTNQVNELTKQMKK
jgi:hypothetical protein